MKSATMRYFDFMKSETMSSFSQSIKLTRSVQSTHKSKNNPNQSNQSIKTADQTSASPYSFAVFFQPFVTALIF